MTRRPCQRSAGGPALAGGSRGSAIPGDALRTGPGARTRCPVRGWISSIAWSRGSTPRTRWHSCRSPPPCYHSRPIDTSASQPAVVGPLESQRRAPRYGVRRLCRHKCGAWAGSRAAGVSFRCVPSSHGPPVPRSRWRPDTRAMCACDHAHRVLPRPAH